MKSDAKVTTIQLLIIIPTHDKRHKNKVKVTQIDDICMIIEMICVHWKYDMTKPAHIIYDIIISH